MAPTVDVIVQPVCLRFRYHQDEIVYMFAASADQQLDRMEQMLGIDPEVDQLFDANLGFLPVASTVLIRGERTILVDPGNHHIGFYGMLRQALASRGVTLEDVDLVVTTHTHADHAASITHLPGRPWVLGKHELEALAASEGESLTRAKCELMGERMEIGPGEPRELMQGVWAVFTPGHTPGHISVLVETRDGRVLVAGDLTMTRSEFEHRRFSHWYSKEQREALNTSLDRVQAWKPTLVIPGHDRQFHVPNSASRY
jgi:N-acyl homoserine lactone hydrolase